MKRIGLCDAHINTKLEELCHLKEMVLRVTPTLSAETGSSGGGQDRLADAVSKIVDMEDEINGEVDRYIDALRETRQVLNKLDDPNQLQVLHKRYVQYKTWEQIACDMDMTYRNVCYIHGKALKAVDEILKHN